MIVYPLRGYQLYLPYGRHTRSGPMITEDFDGALMPARGRDVCASYTSGMQHDGRRSGGGVMGGVMEG